MKKVCPFCNNKVIHKHGKKRRKCAKCFKTFSIESGRKNTKYLDAYLLDRSTLKRISDKTHISRAGVLKNVINELKNIPSIIELSKKFS